MEDQARAAMFAALFGGAGGISPYFVLEVRREHIVEDSLTKLTQAGNRELLKRPLKVKFQGEEGQDAGGVRKEFFAILCRQLLSPEFGEERFTSALRVFLFTYAAPFHLASRHVFRGP